MPEPKPLWEMHDGTAHVGPLDEDHVVRMLLHGLPEGTVCRRVGETEWRSFRTHAPFAAAIERKVAPARAPAPAPAPEGPAVPTQARRLAKSSFAGVGCVLQGVGVLLGVIVALFMAPSIGIGISSVVGLLIVLVLMIAGRQMATGWTCSACGNPVPGKDSRLCPACHAPFVDA